jgi:hypothetical protein
MDDEQTTNWETEELLRWLMNDEPLYRSVNHIARRAHDKELCALHFESWLIDLRNQLSRDTVFGKFLHESLTDVDWDAVVDAFWAK